MKAHLLDILTKQPIIQGELEYNDGPYQDTLIIDIADPTLDGRTFILSLENGKRGNVRLHRQNIFTAAPGERDPHTYNVEFLGEGWLK
jgi:hypothetical protein